MEKQPKYKIYPSLLDSFQNYLDSDLIWQKYWGGSENPPHTPDEFRGVQFQSVIDKINRVPMKWEDSEKADKGTAFNEVIDCIIHHSTSDRISVERVYKIVGWGDVSGDAEDRFADVEQTDELTGLNVKFNNREFYFPIEICRYMASLYPKALSQVMTEGIITTAYGDVLLYGYIDELMPQSVHDIKTTGRYSFGNFKRHSQHLVYPYCLIKSGVFIHRFEYNITDFKEHYSEVYVFDEGRDIPILRSKCERLIEFVEENKNLITDKKIFGGEKE